MNVLLLRITKLFSCNLVTANKQHAIKTIQEFLNNHPDNTYLLQNEDGTSMDVSQVETRK